MWCPRVTQKDCLYLGASSSSLQSSVTILFSSFICGMKFLLEGGVSGVCSSLRPFHRYFSSSVWIRKVGCIKFLILSLSLQQRSYVGKSSLYFLVYTQFG